MDLTDEKQALRLIPYGLYVIGSGIDDEIHAFTGSWLTQASFAPALLAVGVSLRNRGHELIQRSGGFSINFLDDSQQEIARHFFRSARLVGNRLGAFEFDVASNGAPLLSDALAHVVCAVRQSIPTGDHSLFIGEILSARVLRDAPSLDLRATGWRYNR